MQTVMDDENLAVANLELISQSLDIVELKINSETKSNLLASKNMNGSLEFLDLGENMSLNFNVAIILNL